MSHRSASSGMPELRRASRSSSWEMPSDVVAIRRSKTCRAGNANPSMNHSRTALIAATAALATGGASALAADHPSHTAPTAVAHQQALQDGMRKLWEDHITWTRLAIVSFAAGSPDLPATEARLLRNQADIANAIKPYYGTAASAKLRGLLRQHILGAVALLQAAKANDAAALGRAH